MVMYVTEAVLDRETNVVRTQRRRITHAEMRERVRKSGYVSDIAHLYERMGPERFEEYCWDLKRRDSYQSVAEAIGPSFFPNITLDAQHKMVLRGYADIDEDWRKVCKVGRAADFKVQSRIAASELPDVPEVSVGGSYTNVILSDEKASYSVKRRGYMFEADIETRANDDLGILNDIPRKFGRGVGRARNRFFFTTNLQADPTIYDGLALFHANHSNTVSSAGTVNVANIESGIVKMTQQKGRLRAHPVTEGGVIPAAGGSDEIGIVPRWLVCNLAQAPAAERCLATMRLDAGGTTTGLTLPGEAVDNAFVRRTLRGVVATPFLTTASTWYLMADPGEFDTFEMGFWRGVEEPEVSQELVGSSYEFETDAQRTKVRSTWGGAWLDFRTVVRLAA